MHWTAPAQVDEWQLTAHWAFPARIALLRVPGLSVPGHWFVAVVGGLVAVDMAVAIEHQRLAIDRVHFARTTPAPLTVATIRSVPLERLVLASAEAIAFKTELSEDGSTFHLEPGVPAGEASRALRQPRRVPQSDLLTRVVELHKALTAGPAPDRAPAATIGAELGYKAAYVRTLLVRARKEGLLPPVPRR
jgi:hypothetical protein